MKDTPNGVTTGTSASAPGPASKARLRGPGRNLGTGASSQARRQAAAILEVLAGLRTPNQAALALGLSAQRYYLLEERALHAILAACEPRSIGRAPSSTSALAALQRECEQLRRECARQQALVRAAQRAIGLAPPAAPAAKPARDGKKRRQRRPMARALHAAARLQSEPAPAPVVLDKEAVQG